jgi:phosphohistidine phosphatase
MRTLYLLRHAKSSWDNPALADHERPLAPRGRRAAKRIAEHMLRSGIEPELVLCSTAVRARQTLELVRAAIPGSSVALEAALYGASADELLARVRRLPDAVGSVMLVGHNPGLQDLALLLAAGDGEAARVEAKFPTGALATLTLRTTWSGLAPAGATLAAVTVPRELQ